MRILLILLFLSVSLLAQTRSDLEKKYTAIGENVYRVRPGIAVEVEFSENGKASTLKIVPEDRENQNARLGIDAVRAVIGELVPGLFCFRGHSFAEIKVSCPPKNDCRGIQENWERGTTLMVSDRKQRIVYNLITLTGTSEPPPGGIKLLPGYEHVPSCGIDTVAGNIKKSGGIEIHYDIGVMAGNFAIRYADSAVAEWTRMEKVHGDSVLVVLTKEKRILATFERAVANFTAKVSSQSDIDDFLKMILTYNPPTKK